MKLEKCALCGKAARDVVPGRVATCSAKSTKQCAMRFFVRETGCWNRLQRAIAKAAPAGRVLCRLWACDARPRCRPCLYRQCDTRIRRKYNCRRVEVRELGGRK